MKRTQLGNPILREGTRRLTSSEVKSTSVQTLIEAMQYTLSHKKLGVGLAAPQIGKDIALAIIKIQSTEHRPKVEPYEAVIINPEITEFVGRKKSMWEGCISAGSSGKADLFAKVPRYNKVRVKYFDQNYELHYELFDGLRAQIMQHEIDHLNGILFVDRVKDTTTYMNYKEYVKRVKQPKG